MKIKLHLVALLTLMSIGFVNAQNLDKNKVTFKYTRMPLTPFPEEIKAYNVKMDLGYVSQGDSRTDIENKIKSVAEIDHLEKTVRDGVQLFIRIENYYKSEKIVKETVKEEKRGDEKVKVTYYAYSFDYKYPMYFEARIPNEVDPFSADFINNSDGMKTFNSPQFKSRSELSKWWNSNYKTKQSQLRRDILNSNLNSLKGFLADRFGYQVVSETMKLVTVKKFKKFEYTDVNNAFTLASEAFGLIKEDEMLFNDAFKNKITEAINIWKKALEESDTENKKTRINKKVTEAIYVNIYKANIFTDNFAIAESIETEANEKIKNAISKGHKRPLLDRQQRYEANISRLK